MTGKCVEDFFANDDVESHDEDIVENETHHSQFVCEFRSAEKNSADIANISNMGMTIIN